MISFRQTGVVYHKELTDVIRDRRTLFSMILLPIILIPLIGGGLGGMMGSQIKKLEERNFTICLIGGGSAPELAGYLEAKEQFQVISAEFDSGLAVELLKDKAALAVIRVPVGFDRRLREFFRGESEAPALEVFYDESEIESDVATGRLRGALSEYRMKMVSAELERLNLRGDITEPFTIEAVNTATEEEMGGFIASMMLPLMLILLSITGAMYPAIDLTAGEKERGTLETLLVSPVGRGEMVLGKFLTVMTTSLVTTCLVLLSTVFTISGGLTFGSAMGENAGISFNFIHIAGALVMVTPLTAFFSALLLTIALFAKSYKEAQSYISPLMLAVILPAMVSILPGIELSPKLLLIPVLNVAMMLKEALLGRYDMSMIAITFMSSAVYAGIAIWIAFRQFHRESVLFRT